MSRKAKSDDQIGRSKHQADDPLYEVGYRKPPTAHRFRKGQSGNPSGSRRKAGRSPSAKTLTAELIDELGQPIAVTEGGRRRRVPRQTALIKKMIADALNGDAKARTQLIQLACRADATSDSSDQEDLIGAAKDAEILERFRAEIIKQYREANND